MLFKNSKKIVIKLGSSTVVDHKGNFKGNWVKSLIKDIKKFKKKSDFVIVSSGAIALGQNYLKIKNNRSFFGDFDPFGDFDLIFGASKIGLKIIDIPVRYQNRKYGKTQISRFTHGWLLIKMTIFALFKIKFH